jgi:hypothetical protein
MLNVLTRSGVFRNKLLYKIVRLVRHRPIKTILAHLQRIAGRVDCVDSESEGSLDSQAPLMDDIKTVEGLLERAEQWLKHHEESLRVQKLLKAENQSNLDDDTTVLPS